MNVWSWLADAVVAFHLFWIVFLILGALPGYFYAWVKWTHVAALSFSVAMQLFHWTCPLTLLEQALRRAAGTSYAGSFIGHYSERLVYAPISPVWILTGTLVVVAVSAWVYLIAARRTTDDTRDAD